MQGPCQGRRFALRARVVGISGDCERELGTCDNTVGLDVLHFARQKMRDARSMANTRDVQKTVCHHQDLTVG